MRFLVIIISDDDTFYNLCLVQSHGKATAEKYIQHFKIKTPCLWIDINRDIIAFVSNGCNIIIKVGKHTKIPYIMCVVHTVNLAISKLLGEIIIFESSGHENEYKEEYNYS